MYVGTISVNILREFRRKKMINQVPEINEAFNEFSKRVFETQVLTEREKGLVALATVTSFEDADAVKQAVMNAKQLDISVQEIGCVMAIVAAMKGQKITKLLEQGGKRNGGRCC